ncbi:hypothetical protein [Rubrivirga marina]|uniref:Uncharacterized protein n=1 Tax=Rubrivirga marina TaxID=1196024 RepID=A0A271J493_9BACT|nr:hypothetical protein [Rubrivirga marina]PAP77864.1 hypothetical protein BSZ37_16165 [Rubrivirga marina]
MLLALTGLALALHVVGCDAVGDQPEAYRGVVEVSVVALDASAYGLRLVAVEDRGCDRRLVVSTRFDAERQRIEVEGIGPETPCDGLLPASAVVPLVRAGGGAFVEVRHRDSADLYVLLDDVAGGPSLQTIRATTTRPAEESAAARG